MNLIGKHIGNYVAVSELGHGGMGVVYLCEHPLIHRKVAAKVLHEELAASEEIAKRLFQEAKAANRIDSEHIIEVIDFGKIDTDAGPLVYLLMELLSGESLADRLWRTGMTIDESLHVVAQCCQALEQSHKKGIIHRDLKPENLFLVERNGDANFIKILDFGIAKITADPSTKTKTGVLLGTPTYMSPEQCRGSGTIDHRSDIYSLGVVLYELVTGNVPFAGDGYGSTLLAHMTQKLVPPSAVNNSVPPIIDAIVCRAMEKDREQRYASMAELAAAVAEAEKFLQVTPTIPRIPHRSLHQRSTHLLDRTSAKTVADPSLQKTIVPSGDEGLRAPRPSAADTQMPTQIMAAIQRPASNPPPEDDNRPTILDAQELVKAAMAEAPAQPPTSVTPAAPTAPIRPASSGTTPMAPTPLASAATLAPQPLATAPTQLPQAARATAPDPVVGPQTSKKAGFHQLPTLIKDPAVAERYVPTGKTPQIQTTDEMAATFLPQTRRLAAIGVGVVAVLGLLIWLALRH
jgi:serine/threonine protein kinase